MRIHEYQEHKPALARQTAGDIVAKLDPDTITTLWFGGP
jgi:hypothetical protein